MTCVAELNGEAPIEESFSKHYQDQVLGEDDSDDDSDSASNIYGSVCDVL